jgi:hypothetical protein
VRESAKELGFERLEFADDRLFRGRPHPFLWHE